MIMRSVVVGYQGIGKSTLAYTYSNVVDLESSNFYLCGSRIPGWEDIYARLAIHIAAQGKVVCVSSHKAVRDALRDNIAGWAVDLYICYPDISIKNKWTTMLLERYQNSLLDKDYRAYVNAYDAYESSISDLASESSIFKKIVITSMDYDLSDIFKKNNINLKK